MVSEKGGPGRGDHYKDLVSEKKKEKKKSGFERAVFLGGSLHCSRRVWFQKKVVLPERFITKYLKGMGWEKCGHERNGVYHIEI